MEREFLGWDEMPLDRAASWLVENIGTDMSDVLVALPGARSGRLLGERLARLAGPTLRPPEVRTAGMASDALLQIEGATASRLVRTLAWKRALSELDPGSLARIVARAPEAGDLAGWMRLAEEVRTLFGEVAAEGLEFAEVAENEMLAPLEGEQRRWRALANAQELMTRVLDETGLSDPHIARLQAIRAARVRHDRRVVLVGVSEMNALLRRALELCEAETTALIFAPEAHAKRFDDHGPLIPEAWSGFEIDLDAESQWFGVDRRVDQADPAGSAWDRARFAQLSELAFSFDARAGLRHSDFVDHVRSERVESPGGARVRVMTIHGAKGLEFDAVILPELHKALVGRRSGLLVDRPRPDGPIETVSVSSSKDLLATDPAGVIWSHPDNAPGDGWAAKLRGEAEDAQAVPAALELAPSTGPRGLARRSPSAEEGDQRVDAKWLLREQRGARRGTLVHRWLEGLEWIEGFELDEANALEIAGTLEPDLAIRRTELEGLGRALQAEPVHAALSREGCGAPAGLDFEVRKEHAFSTLLAEEAGEEQLWTGSIDRLMLGSRDGEVVWADVLDYKTDPVSEAGLDEHVERYGPQLQSYGRVVAAQTDLAPNAIRLRLVFLEPGRVIDLPPA